MKLITFTANQYLSDKQCGIQSTHAAIRLYSRFCEDSASDEFQYFDEWAHNHETAVFLRGGNSVILEKIEDTLLDYCRELRLPLVTFKEDETLNYALTAVALIFPEKEELFEVDEAMDAAWDALREYLDGFSLL